MCFENDKLIEGGRLSNMNNGTGYREVRQFQTDCYLLRFYFVTRCYGTYMESILSDLSGELQPDVVIMNSCLWDISRYVHPESVVFFDHGCRGYLMFCIVTKCKYIVDLSPTLLLKIGSLESIYHLKGFYTDQAMLIFVVCIGLLK